MGREQRIQFDLTLDPFYAPENMAYIKKQIEDVHNGTITLEEHDLIEDWICANYYGHPMHDGKTIITQKEKSPVIGLFFYDEDMNGKHVCIILTIIMYTSAVVAYVTTNNVALLITFASMSFLAYFTLLHFQQTACTIHSNQVDYKPRNQDN